MITPQRLRELAAVCLAALVVLPAPPAFAAATISFAPAQHYTASTAWSCMGAGAIASADFTGDGARDLVVADVASQGPAVLINKGDGAFNAPALVPAGGDACTVQVGEFNGDGQADIVSIGNFTTPVLTVLLGHGDGTFTPGQRIPVGVWSQQIAVADFDHDGDQDLAVTKTAPGALGLLLGNGDGTFADGGPVPLGWEVPAVAAADLNADGAIDLVASDESVDGVLVALGNGDATFTEPRSYPGGGGGVRYIVAADVDLDGDLDLVLASSSSNSVSVLMGNGDGSFGAETRYLQGPVIEDFTTESDVSAGVAVADFNADGWPDIAATKFQHSKVYLLAGTGSAGDGGFEPAGEYAVASGPEPVLAEDFDDDGRIDLAVPGNLPALPSPKTAVSILLNTSPAAGPASMFADPTPYANGDVGNMGDQATVAVADFDGDGANDIAATDPGGGLVRFMFNHGDGTFADNVVVPAGNLPTVVRECDLNVDGLPDAVVAESGSLLVLRNDGDRTFTRIGSYQAGQRLRHILCDDYDRDGRPDLAVLGNGTRATITVLLGDGQGGLSPRPAMEFGTTLLDGDPDALDPPWNSATEHVYPAYQQMDSGDLDGDSLLDIVAAGGARLYVFEGLGDGSFAPGPQVRVDTPALEPIQLADLNGDGNLDAVVPLPSENFVDVFPGNGDTTFGPAIRSQVNPAAERPIVDGAEEDDTVAVACDVVDLDGDGLLGLAVSGGLDHSVWIMRGDGAGRFTPVERHYVTSAGVMQEIRAVVASDLTGDARPDLAMGAMGLIGQTWVMLQRPGAPEG